MISELDSFEHAVRPALHATDTQMLAAVALALVTLALATAFHFEALRFLLRRAARSSISRGGAVRLLAALVAVHMAEIALWAGAYSLGSDVLNLGALHGSTDRSAYDYSYFAAETYSTLGYGDLVPTGALRLVASVEALNGLLLLSWSGAFLFGMLREGLRTEILTLERERKALRGAQPALSPSVVQAAREHATVAVPIATPAGAGLSADRSPGSSTIDGLARAMQSDVREVGRVYEPELTAAGAPRRPDR